MAAKKKMGRPSLLTDAITKKIAQHVRAGNYLETAALLCGIPNMTARTWLARGNTEMKRLADNPRARVKKAETIYYNFSLAIKKAQAEADAHDLKILGNSGDWQATAWRLERRDPQKYGRAPRKSKFENKAEQEKVKLLQAQRHRIEAEIEKLSKQQGAGGERVIIVDDIKKVLNGEIDDYTKDQ